MFSLRDYMVHVNVSPGVDPENLLLDADWIDTISQEESRVWGALMVCNGSSVTFGKLAEMSLCSLNGTKTALQKLQRRGFLNGLPEED